MGAADWIVELFECIDRKDADGLAARLTEDASFRFANAPPVTGRAAIRDAVAGFFSGVEALEHRLLETWVQPDVAICRGEVAYTRLDGSRLQVPFANIFKLRGDLIHDYLIYVDASALFASA